MYAHVIGLDRGTLLLYRSALEYTKSLFSIYLSSVLTRVKIVLRSLLEFHCLSCVEFVRVFRIDFHALSFFSQLQLLLLSNTSHLSNNSFSLSTETLLERNFWQKKFHFEEAKAEAWFLRRGQKECLKNIELKILDYLEIGHFHIRH